LAELARTYNSRMPSSDSAAVDTWVLASGHVGGIAVPELLATVARVLGTPSAGLTLLGATRYEESAIASDATAAAAQELEFTLCEGPVHDAADSRRLVVADEKDMPARWSRYSAAVAELGVRSVAAAPLCLRGRCLGVLAAFNPPDHTAGTTVGGVAAALAGTILVASSMRLVDDRMVVHQATGMIAARLGCPIGDALAMLRARAFAANEAIGVLARRVVDRDIQFDDWSDHD
jgi:hypothetical protein